MGSMQTFTVKFTALYLAPYYGCQVNHRKCYGFFVYIVRFYRAVGRSLWHAKSVPFNLYKLVGACIIKGSGHYW